MKLLQGREDLTAFKILLGSIACLDKFLTTFPQASQAQVTQEEFAVPYDILIATSVSLHLQFPLPEMLPTATCQAHP